MAEWSTCPKCNRGRRYGDTELKREHGWKRVEWFCWECLHYVIVRDELQEPLHVPSVELQATREQAHKVA
jgi:hypothetical protein